MEKNLHLDSSRKKKKDERATNGLVTFYSSIFEKREKVIPALDDDSHPMNFVKIGIYFPFIQLFS
jgi:hypothetical protein